MTAGIDVAWPQGANYDWRQWAGRIQFGMCKATEDETLIDPYFEENWNAMWSMDSRMPRFAYHEFHAGQRPAVQAQHLVETVRARGLLPGDNLVAVFETSAGNAGIAPHVVAEKGVQFLHYVNEFAPGHHVLAYSDPAYIEAGNCAGMGPWPLWVADYGVEQPAVPSPWDRWTMWQCGDSPVDQDRFNGDEAALMAFCGMPASR